jgi:hypothetical protein
MHVTRQRRCALTFFQPSTLACIQTAEIACCGIYSATLSLCLQGTQLKLELHSGETPQKLTGAENRAGGGEERVLVRMRGAGISSLAKTTLCLFVTIRLRQHRH